MIECFVGNAFGVFSCRFGAVWCSAADTHHELLDWVVSGACFLTGVFECDIEHCRSYAV